jgi:cobalt/nickel transport system ATP-binding protein
MMHCLETLFENSCSHNRLGMITVINVNLENQEHLLKWLSTHKGICIGAMGTRGKQYAENSLIHLDFTYGVIDKCILKALLGEDSLILTTESMVRRVYQRVDAYGLESGVHIPVNHLITAPEETNGKNRSIP